MERVDGTSVGDADISGLSGQDRNDVSVMMNLEDDQLTAGGEDCSMDNGTVPQGAVRVPGDADRSQLVELFVEFVHSTGVLF